MRNLEQLVQEGASCHQGVQLAQYSSTSSSLRPNFASQNTLFEIPSNVPRALRTLLKSVKDKSPTFTVTIPLNPDNFGKDLAYLYIRKEDIMQFGKIEQIGAQCISVYMR